MCIHIYIYPYTVHLSVGRIVLFHWHLVAAGSLKHIGLNRAQERRCQKGADMIWGSSKKICVCIYMCIYIYSFCFAPLYRYNLNCPECMCPQVGRPLLPGNSNSGRLFLDCDDYLPNTV